MIVIKIKPACYESNEVVNVALTVCFQFYYATNTFEDSIKRKLFLPRHLVIGIKKIIWNSFTEMKIWISYSNRGSFCHSIAV